MPGRLAQETALDREPDLDRPGLDQRRGIRRDRGGAPLGLCGEQAPRIGVLRVAEDFGDRPLLDDLALQHHADPVGDAPDDAEVMRDEQHRHAQAFLQFLQQLQDLGLHGDVECRGRLVGDQQVRFVGERHRDHHALALPAGELVRIGVEPACRIADADEVEQFERARPRAIAAQAFVQFENLADLPRDRVQRVERGHRLLEHHGDVVAAHLAHRILVGRDQVLSVEHHLAGGMVRGWVVQQLQDRERRNRLAGAGFADDGERFALGEIEGDAIDGERLAPALAEGDGEVLDGEEGGGHSQTSRSST